MFSLLDLMQINIWIEDANYWDEDFELILRLTAPKLIEVESKEISRTISLNIDMKNIIILFI